jgi:geranylgeranyl diphosphate synthase, type II
MTDHSTFSATYLPVFESALLKSIQFNCTDNRKHLEDAIHHIVSNPGKRIRPLLCMATEYSITGNVSASIPLAVAIELIHCYSLIHDDLPAMDNDDFRRGKPSCHKAFGEDTAILAGDVLNTYVFEYLTQELPKHTKADTALYIIQDFAKACGLFGMAGGQLLDLKSNNNSDIATLETIHSLKTGAILSACFTLTATLCNVSNAQHQTWADIGQNFGLMFQIIDDILDATGTFEDIGKSPGKDEAQKKLTYVSVHGIDGAMAQASKQYQASQTTMTQLSLQHNIITPMFDYIYEKGAQYAKS